MASIYTLIDALSQYSGTLVFISHDVHFIRKIAKHVIHVEGGRLRHYPGPAHILIKQDRIPVAQQRPAWKTGNRKKMQRRQNEKYANARKRREAEERQALSKKRRLNKFCVDRL